MKMRNGIKRNWIPRLRDRFW